MSESARQRRREAAETTEPRVGGTHLSLYNSGREVWLYDDANADAIRAAGAIGWSERAPAEPLETLIARGEIIGYELQQDDELEIAVHVGPPLTDAELAVARWLAPQTAWLRLPSGRLCVEANDSLRVGTETPTASGGVVDVPPGDYRVTLYRIDHEALFRERRDWKGAQEVIVLTPGGTTGDAAEGLLPFEARRDLGWVGKYEISGARAKALAWLGDYFDTCIVNLDAPAVAHLGLRPGAHLRIRVPDAGLDMIVAYAQSWAEAHRVPRPGGVSLEEYGVAALCPMAEWDGAEALFCRREAATHRIENEHHDVWLPAMVEILDPAAHPPVERDAIGSFAASDLAAKPYYDRSFLNVVLSEQLPEVEDLDDLKLPDALRRLDRRLAKMGLVMRGDVEWTESTAHGEDERACRLYAGELAGLVAIMASPGSLDLLFITELADGRWIVTGLADEFESRLLAANRRGAGNERVLVTTVDESLKRIAGAHAKAVRAATGEPVPAPASLDECAAALRRLLDAAFGG